jgi:HicB family
MQVVSYVQAISEDLERIAAVGDETTARVGELLAGALEPSLGRRLQEALSEAAFELSRQLPEGRIEVRVAGGDPEMVYVADEPPAAATDGGDEALSARITLRLSESLKSRVEDAAASGGLSLNTWIVRTLARAVESRPIETRARQRLTGHGQG